MRLLALALSVTAVGCVCGTSTIGQGTHDSGQGGGPGGAGGMGGGAPCQDGDACGDGGVCAGGSCCPGASACASACCGGAEVCSFLLCVTPGAACRDSTDCASGQFCDLSQAGPTPVSDGGQCVGASAPGRCLPQPPKCAPDAGSGNGSCVTTCQFTRASQAFNPEVKYSWGDPTAAGTPNDVMMAPIVTQLDDDDCDGLITARDMPDIVVVTFAGGAYTAAGTVHALSVKGGTLQEKWATPGLIRASSQLASANIDEAPGTEVLGCGPNGVVALHGADGTTLWNHPGASCTYLQVADLGGDGHVEVITDSEVLDGRTGALVMSLPSGANNVVADLDGDGQLDVIAAPWAVRADGGTLVTAAGVAGSVAIADLNHDGVPEVVAVNSSTHTLAIWSYDPASAGSARVVRTGVDVNAGLDPTRCPAGSAGRLYGGGPPTVGDFNGDGWPDVALAGGVGFSVFNGQLLMDAGVANASTTLWSKVTQDCSSAATGSTLFDFDGDGRVEAVYADELNLHVYDGVTGNDVFTTCNTSGTLVEFPVVADVDNDGQADLVVVSNAYAFACTGSTTRHSGVRVFSSADHNWVLTRRIWNQHAYSVTNIEEDATVPRVPKTNWLEPGLDNFRQQKQPGQEFAAADAVVSVATACGTGITWKVTVRNVGEASMPPGIHVELVSDPATNPQVFATVTTTRVLGPLQSETLVVTTPDQALATVPVRARIVPNVALRECRTDNNESDPPTVACIG